MVSKQASHRFEVVSPPHLHGAATSFLEFLRHAGKPHSVRVRYESAHAGSIAAELEGPPGRIDALLQELILNRALYYYGCGVSDAPRRAVLDKVVIPVFQDLLETRFWNPHARFVRRHVYGRVAHDEFVPSDLYDGDSRTYEILFRKWDLGLIDDRSFVLEVDTFLTNFMLKYLAHAPGQKSPKFARLVQLSRVTGMAMDKDVAEAFNAIHEARTKLLHRRVAALHQADLQAAARRLYMYFEYFDEFIESQAIRMEVLRGRRYLRIKYGEEILDGDGPPRSRRRSTGELPTRPCHDCFALVGQYHAEGCDWEQCACCGGQRLGCPCAGDPDDPVVRELERLLEEPALTEGVGLPAPRPRSGYRS